MDFIKKQQFHPGWPAMFCNPFYFARKGLYRQLSELAPRLTGSMLDVGCGNKPYEKLFGNLVVTGMEIDTPENRWRKRADVFYNGRFFPFRDGEFDSVLVSQVLEHVFNPDEFLREIQRVLKPGGRLLLTVPFVWDEHEQPFDYARYTSFGLAFLLERHGFVLVEQRKSVQDIRVVFQMLNAYLYKKAQVTRSDHLNFLLAMVLTAPVNIVGEVIGWILPSNTDLYLDNIILVEKKGGGDDLRPGEER